MGSWAVNKASIFHIRHSSLGWPTLQFMHNDLEPYVSSCGVVFINVESMLIHLFDMAEHKIGIARSTCHSVWNAMLLLLLLMGSMSVRNCRFVVDHVHDASLFFKMSMFEYSNLDQRRACLKALFLASGWKR